MIKIVIAEDHHVVRQGLKLLLAEMEPGFRLVGEAADGLEAIRLCERLKPTLLLLDLMLPKLHGLEVTRQLKASKASPKIVILSMHADEPYVVQAMRNGADGYVLKSASAAELVQAMHRVLGGCRHFSKGIPEDAVSLSLNKKEERSPDPYEKLSSRERTVFQLTAEGLSNAEIAARLFISPRTAETHRANLMEKLKLRSRTELVKLAIRRRIISA